MLGKHDQGFLAAATLAASTLAAATLAAATLAAATVAVVCCSGWRSIRDYPLSIAGTGCIKTSDHHKLKCDLAKNKKKAA